MAGEMQKLERLLSGTAIDPVVIHHMRERLMMVSVSDFVNYVDHSAYETKLGPAVLETLPPTRNRPHAMANSRTQLTRLIFAWEAAFNQPVQDVVHRRDEASTAEAPPLRHSQGTSKAREGILRRV